MPLWLGAGTDIAEPYPCRCRKSCDPAWCECAGRPDLDTMPDGCCGRRYSPADVVIARREYDARSARRRAATRAEG